MLYVDDVLVVASFEDILEIFELFERRYRVKRTGLEASCTENIVAESCAWVCTNYAER